MDEAGTISVTQLASLCGQRAVHLIDVRTPVEFRAVHIAGARNVPLDSLDPRTIGEQLNGTSEPLYVICQGGGRGANACQKLLAAGLPKVVNVAGGTRAWVEAGLPVERGSKAVSLERQVRIAAGSLTLIAVGLGYFVDPGFHAVAACIGAGLLHAGITDNCAMGMMLARMPWNQVAPDTQLADASCTA